VFGGTGPLNSIELYCAVQVYPLWGLKRLLLGFGVLGEIQVSLALVNYSLIRVVRSSYSLYGGTVRISQTQSFLVLSTHFASR
jgi:hypothetical protein